MAADFIQVLLFQVPVGLSFAMYIWLVAAGLTLIFGVLGIINFAHGSLYMLGAYVTYTAYLLTGSFWIGLVIAPALVALVGGVMERFFCVESTIWT